MDTTSSQGRVTGGARGALARLDRLLGIPATLALLNLGFLMAVGVLVALPLGSAAMATAVAAAATSAVVGGAIVSLLARVPFQVTSPSSSVVVIYAALAADLVRQPGATFASVWASLSLAVVVMGLLLLVSARFRLADAVRFLPAPVSAGFISGIGLLVIWSQVGPFLGIPGRIGALPLPELLAAVKPGALVVGSLAVAGVLAHQRFKLPGPAHIVALLVATLAHHLLAAAGVGVGPTLGSIQPLATQVATATASLSAPLQTVRAALPIVLPYAAFLVLQALMNAAVVTSAASAIVGQSVDVHRTVKAQGWANIACGALGGLPVCTNATVSLWAARRRSRWQDVATSCLLLFAIIFIVGGFLPHVPVAALAGTLVVSGIALIDHWARRLSRHAIRSRGRDRVVMTQLGLVAAVAGCFFFGGVPLALLVGSVLATVLLAVNLSRATRTTVENAARVGSTRVWSAPHAAWLGGQRHSITIVRPRGGLFFGTAEQLGRAMSSVAPTQTHCIVDMARLSTLDASGCQLLSACATRLQAQGTKTLITGFAAHSEEGKAMVELGLDCPTAEGWLPDLDHALERAETDLLARAGFLQGGEDAIAATPLMNGLGEEAATRLRARLVSRVVEPGRLFSSGEAAQSMFIVESGRVEILVHSAQNRKTTRLASFGPGSIFGEVSLLSTGVRTADAWCVEPCRLLELSREAFDALEQQDPWLHAQVLRNLGVHLANRLVIATATIEAQQ
jgi:SulP family sulfate permease